MLHLIDQRGTVFHFGINGRCYEWIFLTPKFAFRLIYGKPTSTWADVEEMEEDNEWHRPTKRCHVA